LFGGHEIIYFGSEMQDEFVAFDRQRQGAAVAQRRRRIQALLPTGLAKVFRAELWRRSILHDFGQINT
jgi:hypothetical protein